MAFVNDIRTHDHGIAERISGLVSKVSERLAQYKIYRTTVVELSQLSDRDLTDLGIHRTMIGSVARDAAYGK